MDPRPADLHTLLPQADDRRAESAPVAYRATTLSE